MLTAVANAIDAPHKYAVNYDHSTYPVALTVVLGWQELWSRGRGNVSGKKAHEHKGHAMTFSQLIEAVQRDVKAIDPTHSVAVHCESWYFGCSDSPRHEIEFAIWCDHTQTRYTGSTPAEVYGKWAADHVDCGAASDAALALCDTPEIA